jgi:glutamate--cysteine ligase
MAGASLWNPAGKWNSPARPLFNRNRKGHKGFLARLHEIAEANECVFLAAGFDPVRRLDEQRWFPKARYAVMRPYLAAHGARAWDMMARTCAVQVNLDYDSEADLAQNLF